MINSPSRAASESVMVRPQEEVMAKLRQRMSFEEFIEWHPDDGKFELWGGVPVGMPNATGPQQPTITVCSLVDGEYELSQFRAGDAIAITVLPEPELSVDVVFAVAGH